MNTTSALHTLKRLCQVPVSCSLALCLGLGACDKEKDIDPAPAPVASVTANPEPANPEPAKPEPAKPEPAPETADTLAYELSAHSQHQKNPNPESTSATATSTGGTVTVTIQNFTYYCQPAPRFQTSQESGVLRLTLQKPTGAISRCVESHDMTLTFAGIDMNAEVNSVEIAGDDDKVLASAAIARTR